MARKKFYVVWEGHVTGIFNNWPCTVDATYDYPSPKFKGFATYQEAKLAFSMSYEEYRQYEKKRPDKPDSSWLTSFEVDIEF